FVSGIDVDPSNPNHAFVSYSGYNAYATAAGKKVGHLFEVTYNPVSHTATWSSDLADHPAGELGDVPVRAIAVVWQENSPLNFFGEAASGFLVIGSGTWLRAASGLPEVVSYGLRLNVDNRILFAATHGRSIYSLSLP